ncbi:MarR family winged helix-turn-helix transcriptional regulator [Brevibacillus migulae]|uniref:MarR family winged helix-turn-helix transcriptional regulator n=1 Tax=Brevibacillus migulae TaxID=1644114 RepID=UPI00106EFA3B|nr:MarR family transcriptional regulator [Brevibacillus migulae]
MKRDTFAIRPMSLTELTPFLAKESPSLDLFLNFFGTYRVVSSTVEQHLEKFGLNEAKCSILMLLLRHQDGMAPSQLADFLNVTRGTVTSLIESLKHAGFVDRHPNRFDRRTVTIRLTEKGSEYITAFLSTVPKLREEILAQLEASSQIMRADESETSGKKPKKLAKG